MSKKEKLGTDARGNYRRRIGRNQDGNPQAFYFGKDKLTALNRNRNLESLWEKCKPAWTADTLAIAKAIANGEPEVEFPEIDLKGSGLRKIVEQEREQTLKDVGFKKGAGLHDAIRGWRRHLEGDKVDVSGRQTEWGRKTVEMADRLLEHHDDCDLAALDLAACEQIIDYWRGRPKHKRTKNPIAVTTARNQLSHVRAFFKWLGRQKAFGWQRPPELMDYRVKIRKTAEDKAKKAQRLPTYSVEQLRTLYHESTPLVRTFMLLALNCAFKQAEIGQLLRSEIKLGIKHPHYKTQGNFIFRVRHKSGVYGEWKLWPNTVALLQAARTDGKHALITENGTTYGELTKGNNHNQRISNLWKCTLRRAKANDKDFPMLPFTALVDTAVDMVRDVAGGEVAAVFKCHGKPVADGLLDLYSGRPFNKVFDALDKIVDDLKLG